MFWNVASADVWVGQLKTCRPREKLQHMDEVTAVVELTAIVVGR